MILDPAGHSGYEAGTTTMLSNITYQTYLIVSYILILMYEHIISKYVPFEDFPVFQKIKIL